MFRSKVKLTDQNLNQQMLDRQINFLIKRSKDISTDQNVGYTDEDLDQQIIIQTNILTDQKLD